MNSKSTFFVLVLVTILLLQGCLNKGKDSNKWDGGTWSKREKMSKDGNRGVPLYKGQSNALVQSPCTIELKGQLYFIYQTRGSGIAYQIFDGETWSKQCLLSEYVDEKCITMLNVFYYNNSILLHSSDQWVFYEDRWDVNSSIFQFDGSSWIPFPMPNMSVGGIKESRSFHSIEDNYKQNLNLYHPKGHSQENEVRITSYNGLNWSNSYIDFPTTVNTCKFVEVENELWAIWENSEMRNSQVQYHVGKLSNNKVDFIDTIPTYAYRNCFPNMVKFQDILYITWEEYESKKVLLTSYNNGKFTEPIIINKVDDVGISNPNLLSFKNKLYVYWLRNDDKSWENSWNIYIRSYNGLALGDIFKISEESTHIHSARILNENLFMFWVRISGHECEIEDIMMRSYEIN